jgi:hypothetical protein
MQVNTDSLRESLGYFFNSVFADQEFLTGLTRSVAFRTESTYFLEQDLAKYSSRRDIPSRRLSDSRIFFFDTADMQDADLTYGSGEIYGSGNAAYGIRAVDPENPRFPVGSYEPPYLTTELLKPGTVYTLGQDYAVENGYIVFTKNPLHDDNVEKRALYSDETNIRRTFFMWGFKSLEDHKDLCDFYGTVVGVCSSDIDVLKEAINLAWDMRQIGVTDELLNRVLSLITGVDYIHTKGRADEVYEEGDRLIVRSGDDIYTAPKDCTLRISLGERFEEAQQIFDAYTLVYPNQPLQGEDTVGLALGAAFIPGIDEGVLVPNISSSLYRHRTADWYELVREGSVFLKLDREGRIISTVAEADAIEEIEAAPEEEWRFTVYGQESDKDIFFSNLNSRSAVTQTELNDCDEEVDVTNYKNFFDLLADKYGSLPENIFPLSEVYNTYLSSNSKFVRINRVAVSDSLMAQLLNTVAKTIPAGSTIFISVESTEVTEEKITTNQLEEDVSVFYIVDIEETDQSIKTEGIIAIPQS